MPTRTPNYWLLSCSAGTLKSGRWELEAADRRWECDIAPRLGTGQRIRAWPTPPPLYTYKRVGTVPDARAALRRDPWIISEPLRVFLDHAAPAAAQYLSVRVEGPGRADLYAEYWAVNWLQAWHCHHSRGAEIDPARLPADQPLGFIADGGAFRHEIIARADLKLAIQKAGFVGLRYQRVPLAGHRPRTLRRKNPITGKMETVERRLLPDQPEFDVEAYFASGRGPNDPTHTPNSTAFLDFVRWSSRDEGVDVGVVRRFLAQGGDPNAGHDQPNVSALLVVIDPKTPELLRLLNDHGADWNVFNGLNGFTPLMSAAIQPNPGAVKLLLEFGADPDQLDLCGMTARDHAEEKLRQDPDEEEEMLVNEVLRLLRGH